jgi:signal recognition particle GTPase
MKIYRKTHKKEIKRESKQYYQEHKVIKKKKNKYWYKIHKKQHLKSMKNWRETHKEQYLRLMKEWRKTHKKQINEQQSLRLKKDINFKLTCNLRSRIYHALKENSKSQITINLIGCSIEKLKSYLEKKFTKGILWSNYGKWHIDHIRPCSSFVLSKVSEQRKCFNYKNLQPLWAKENLRKARK